MTQSTKFVAGYENTMPQGLSAMSLRTSPQTGVAIRSPWEPLVPASHRDTGDTDCHSPPGFAMTVVVVRWLQ